MMKPAFTGEFETELSVTLFGETVSRSAKVTYRYTPAWPHFDMETRVERDDDVLFGLGLKILGPPIPNFRSGKMRSKPPGHWLRCDALLAAGVLHPRIYDDLRARIEQEALATDRRNRIFAGIPVPPLPARS